MDLKRAIYVAVVVLFVVCPWFGSAGDIVHRDPNAPKRPGCENNFVLVRHLLIKSIFV